MKRPNSRMAAVNLSIDRSSSENNTELDEILEYDTMQQIQPELGVIDVSCQPGLFQKGVLNVIEWGQRVKYPGKRNIPKEAGSLAILTRGRIRLPIQKAKWLFNKVRELKQAVPENKIIDQLPTNIDKILPFVDVQVELFYRQWDTNLTMTQTEIKQGFHGYLLGRHKEELPNCSKQMFVFAWFPVTAYKDIEKNLLGVPISSLFSKAKVTLPPELHKAEDYRRFLLLVYVSFPDQLKIEKPIDNDRIFIDLLKDTLLNHLEDIFPITSLPNPNNNRVIEIMNRDREEVRVNEKIPQLKCVLSKILAHLEKKVSFDDVYVDTVPNRKGQGFRAVNHFLADLKKDFLKRHESVPFHKLVKVHFEKVRNPLYKTFAEWNRDAIETSSTAVQKMPVCTWIRHFVKKSKQSNSIYFCFKKQIKEFDNQYCIFED